MSPGRREGGVAGARYVPGGSVLPGWFLATAVIALGACTTTSPSHRSSLAPERLAWPAGEPRVELAEVVESADLRRGGVLARLAGHGSDQHAGSSLRRPFGVAWDGEELLVTDVDAGRVVRLRGRRIVAASAVGSLATPIDVAVCGGSIVVSDSRRGRVTLLDAALRPQRDLAGDLDRPTGLACDEAGVVVVETGRHRLLRLAWDGERLGEWGGRGSGPGELNFPAALALSRGTAWVGDTLNFRVQGLDLGGLEGALAFGGLGDAPGEMPRIKGLALDARGHLWVSDALLSRIALFRPDGTFLMHLGGEGAGPGQFAFPAGIAAHPDGRVAVVDSLNRRVQIFRLTAAGEGLDAAP